MTPLIDVLQDLEPCILTAPNLKLYYMVINKISLPLPADFSFLILYVRNLFLKRSTRICISYQDCKTIQCKSLDSGRNGCNFEWTILDNNSLPETLLWFPKLRFIYVKHVFNGGAQHFLEFSHDNSFETWSSDITITYVCSHLSENSILIHAKCWQQRKVQCCHPFVSQEKTGVQDIPRQYGIWSIKSLKKTHNTTKMHRHKPKLSKCVWQHPCHFPAIAHDNYVLSIKHSRYLSITFSDECDWWLAIDYVHLRAVAPFTNTD